MVKLERKKQHDFEDGTTYEGGWEGGVFHGRGRLTWGKFVVECACSSMMLRYDAIKYVRGRCFV